MRLASAHRPFHRLVYTGSLPQFNERLTNGRASRTRCAPNRVLDRWADFRPHTSSARAHSLGQAPSGRAFCVRKLAKFQTNKDQGAKAAMKVLTMTERGALYQISFSANCIWRDVVVVEVRTPAEEIGAPLAPNRLVLLVGTTGEAKFV
jgi:hypothetical protein